MAKRILDRRGYVANKKVYAKLRELGTVAAELARLATKEGAGAIQLRALSALALSEVAYNFVLISMGMHRRKKKKGSA